MNLVLASASPRRRELLERAGLQPVVRPAEIEEALRPRETAVASVLRLARRKAGAVAVPPDAWVLAADTLVVAGGRPLGKPEDRLDAHGMLTLLAGQEHEVITGTCLLAPGGAEASARTVTTRVSFRPVRPAELEAYLDTGEWTDKAGAYGIQGAAATFTSAVHGSYTNVVGLPLAEVVDDLWRLGALPADGGGP